MTRRRQSPLQTGACLVAWALLLAGSRSARADDDPLLRWLQGELQVGVGIDYSEGDYDESIETRMLFVPVSLTYRFDDLALTPTPRDQLELRLVVPYLRVDGALTAGDRDRERAGGLGDVTLGASYLYYPAPTRWPAAELRFSAKLPTADEDEGLGTGKADYGLGLTLFQRYGDLVPFASGGYRFIGENEPDYALRNGATAGVGLSWIVTPRHAVGASYDWRQAVSKRSDRESRLVRADDAHELSFFGSTRVGSRLRLSPYWVLGLSEGSPDFAVGLQMSVTLAVRPSPPGAEPFSD